MHNLTDKQIAQLIAANIRAQRAWGNLTVEEVAERVGCHPMTIYSYEKGRTVPTVRRLGLLAKAFGISPMAFYRDFSKA